MKLAIRFDIDTIRCIKKGVPKLLLLARSTNVPLTFYINMGRAVNLRLSISEAFTKRAESKSQASKLSAVHKLGYAATINTLLFNPMVGASSPHILRNIILNGHELGLHGGRNHATWQRLAGEWTKEQIKAEVEWGINKFRAAGLGTPKSFASPGWNSPQTLPKVLKSCGFKLMADLCLMNKPVFESNSKSSSEIANVNTNLAGHPGGIGFFEWCHVKGFNNKQMLTFVNQELQQNGEAVLYDHPAYSAAGGYSKLEYLLTNLKQQGIEFTTVSELVQKK